MNFYQTETIEKTDAFLVVVEIVPKDRIKGVNLPKNGDQVSYLGAAVNDNLR
jgi:hypothetical protein